MTIYHQGAARAPRELPVAPVDAKDPSYRD